MTFLHGQANVGFSKEDSIPKSNKLKFLKKTFQESTGFDFVKKAFFQPPTNMDLKKKYLFQGPTGVIFWKENIFPKT